MAHIKIRQNNKMKVLWRLQLRRKARASDQIGIKYMTELKNVFSEK